MKVKNNVDLVEISKLLDQHFPIAIFQGRSEVGPRALGNRSILFNPTSRYAKVNINRIKKREYWRPFAGTIMEDHIDNWFEMKSLKRSPFMSYAVKLKCPEISREKIPSIIHEDNTCRIQTLSRDQNPFFYDIINLFYNNGKNPPIIGNTSFNLAGDPLVETLNDAIDTLERSRLEFLYLPDKFELIEISNS